MVRSSQNRNIGEHQPQVLKSILALLSPDKLTGFTCKLEEGLSIVCIILDQKALLGTQNNPCLVTQAALCLSEGSIAICQYPEFKSSTLKYLALPRVSNTSEVLGRG